MTRTSTSKRLRIVAIGLGALIAVVVIIVGAPWLLIRAVGWPLPRSVPSWQHMTDALRSGNVSDETIFKAIALPAWIIWMQLVIAFGIEATREIRHVGNRGRPRLVSAASLLVAARLLAPVVLMLSTLLVRPAIASPYPPTLHRPVAPVTQLDTRARDASSPPPQPIRAATTARSSPPRTAQPQRLAGVVRKWRVQRGDNLWNVAHVALGDGMRWREIFDATRGIAQPDGRSLVDAAIVSPGWILTLPADAHIPADRAVTAMTSSPAPAPAAEPRTLATDAGAPFHSTHVVRRGESLWDISAHELHDPARWPDLYHANDQQIDNPNLIFPGQVLSIPGSPSAVAPAANPTSRPVPVAPPPRPPAPAPHPSAQPKAPEPAAVAAPSTGTRHSDAPASHDHAPPDAHQSTKDNDSDSAISVAERVGWTGGAVLAAGILALAVRLRRRRRPRRQRQRPPQPIVELDLALRTSEPLDDVTWAAATLRSLSGELPAQHSALRATPRLIEVSVSGLEIVWDASCPELADGWTSPDGGRSWRRDRTLPPAARVDRSAPCPALVTLGLRDDATVLANLEAIGILNVQGPGAADVARSMCLELGASPFADISTVLLCGTTVDGVEHYERVQTVALADGLSWLRERAESVTRLAEHAALPTTFALRAHGRDPAEPVTLVVNGEQLDDHSSAQLHSVAQPGSGSVAIVIDPPKPIGEWTLRVEGHTAVLEPVGLQLQTRPVAAQTAAQLSTLLDDAAADSASECDDPNEDSTAGESPPVLRVAEPIDIRESSDLGDARRADVEPYEETACDIEVVLLGQVDVHGAPTSLTPGELELLAYLATHRHGDSADTILTMLWPEGKALKTLRNRVSALRTKLHTGHDGEMLVPYADDDRYRLSALVVTDAERLARRFEYAQAAPSSDAITVLHGALELVSGPPFRAATGYAWAFSEGLATELAETIKQAARWLAELYLDAGDASGALWAARRGALVASPADNQQLTRVVMEAHARLGNTAAALAAYRELVEDLEELDPNIDPDPEITDLYRTITGRVGRPA